MKILKELDTFFQLRPNCLLTRKPVLVVSSTTVYGWSWLKKQLFHWQISRHGFLTKWPTPAIDEIKTHPEKYKNFHILNVDQIKFNQCIDHLIACAENDYLES